MKSVTSMQLMPVGIMLSVIQQHIDVSARITQTITQITTNVNQVSLQIALLRFFNVFLVFIEILEFSKSCLKYTNNAST